MTATNLKNNRATAPVSIIIKAWLIAGTMDISLAFLYSYIKKGTSPVTVLRYISKVVLPVAPDGGNTTLSDPAILAMTGLIIHYAIAMAWTVLFFLVYRSLKLVRINKIITGILYGSFVWTIMNTGILPLWTHKPFAFNPVSSTVNALILMVAIGMPLSFIAHQYYSKKDKEPF